LARRLLDTNILSDIVRKPQGDEVGGSCDAGDSPRDERQGEENAMDVKAADASQQAVRRICEHWNELTLEDFKALMTPDCVYANVPMPHLECVGPEQAHKALSAFADRLGWAELSLINIRGDREVVLTERIERFRTKANPDAIIELPVMGAFELRDGRIAHWRDYFDTRQSAALTG
jgi:limonene-1,2-epoxide hydrolase